MVGAIHKFTCFYHQDFIKLVNEFGYIQVVNLL